VTLAACERQARVDQARARISKLWRLRHGDDTARERVHYWVRVLRILNP
jgi:hypothetical protein